MNTCFFFYCVLIQLFQNLYFTDFTAARFSKEQVGPLVKEMDEKKAMPRALVDQMFFSGVGSCMFYI